MPTHTKKPNLPKLHKNPIGKICLYMSLVQKNLPKMGKEQHLVQKNDKNEESQLFYHPLQQFFLSWQQLKLFSRHLHSNCPDCIAHKNNQENNQFRAVKADIF